MDVRNQIVVRALIIALFINIGVRPEVSAAVDLDGDGREDLLMYSHDGVVPALTTDTTSSAANYPCGAAGGFGVAGAYTGMAPQPASWNPSFGLWTLCRSPQSPGQFPFTVLPWGGPGDLPAPGDFDGDGLADLTIFRRSTREWWSVLSSSTLVQIDRFTEASVDAIPLVGDLDGDLISDRVTVDRSSSSGLRWRTHLSGGGIGDFVLGSEGDLPLLGDFEGTGSDRAWIFTPSSAQWSDGTKPFSFGLPGDIPLILDVDGDGRDDPVVYRPPAARYFIRRSSTAELLELPLNQPARRDRRIAASPEAELVDPRVGLDFDGDRRTDLGLVRVTPNQELAFLFRGNTSVHPVTGVHFGVYGDVVVPGDYDGDALSDLAVLHPEEDRYRWRILLSTNRWNPAQEISFFWGITGDRPLVGDFDGDRKSDPVVVRTNDRGELLWLPRVSGATPLQGTVWGLRGDTPLIGDVDGDGKTDFTVVRTVNGELLWFSRLSGAGGEIIDRPWGLAGDRPVLADFTGDGHADFAVLRLTGFGWQLFVPGRAPVNWGLATDQPVFGAYRGDSTTTSAVWRSEGTADPTGQGVFLLRNGVFGDQSGVGRPFGVRGDVPLSTTEITYSRPPLHSGAGRLSCTTRASIRALSSIGVQAHSNTDGKLVIVFPSTFKRRIKLAALVHPADAADTVVETLTFAGNKGGTRPVFRGKLPGEAYPDQVVLVRVDIENRVHCLDVPTLAGTP